LKVDQSTVSRRLAAIEEVLGGPLLVRGGREFAWTVEGKTALAAAEAAEAAVLAATRQLRSSRLESAGAVRVSATPGNVVMLLRILPKFQDKYPGLDFDLAGSLERVDLAKGEADIALRYARPTEPDLIARHVTRAGWCLFASESYLREQGQPQSFKDLARHCLVLNIPSLHRMGPALRSLSCA
jgi:DNA-binding transcriptional LysR family regulator